MPAAPFQLTVELDQLDQGLAFLDVRVRGALDAGTAQKVSTEVQAQVDALAGRPFGLLIDLRNVTACDEAGAGVMKQLELSAAGKGLEKIAHLVKHHELAQQARAAIAEAGMQQLIGTFEDEAAARRFAGGLAGAEVQQ